MGTHQTPAKNGIQQRTEISARQGISVGLTIEGLGSNPLALASRIDSPIALNLASAVSARNRRSIDPAGLLASLKIRAVQCPLLSDQLQAVSGTLSPVILTVDLNSKIAVFDSRYVDSHSALNSSERNALVQAAIGREITPALADEISNAVLLLHNRDGSFPFEPVGEALLMPGIRGRKVDIGTSSTTSVEPDAALYETICRRLCTAFGPSSVSHVDVKVGLPSLIRLDRDRPAFEFDASLFLLPKEQTLALVDFALATWTATSSVYSSSRQERLSRGMLDVAREVVAGSDRFTHLPSAVAGIAEHGWDTTLASRFLAEVEKATSLRSVQRDIYFRKQAPEESRNYHDVAYGETCKARHLCYQALGKHLWSTIRKIAELPDAVKETERRYPSPSTQILSIVTKLGRISPSEVEQTLNAHPFMREHVNYGRVADTGRIADVMAVLSPQELRTATDAAKVNSLKFALEIPGAHYMDSPTNSMDLRLSLRHLVWFRAILGSDWRAPLEKIEGSKAKIQFLSGLIMTDMMSPSPVKKELEGLSLQLLSGEVRDVFDFLKKTSGSKHLQHLVLYFNDKLVPRASPAEMAFLPAIQSARDSSISRWVFCFAEHLWSTPPSTTGRFALNNPMLVAQLIAANEYRIAPDPELAWRAALLLAANQLRAPGVLEESFTRLIERMPKKVFAERPDSHGVYAHERAALRYALSTCDVPSHAAAIARLAEVVEGSGAPDAAFVGYVHSLMRVDQSAASVRIACLFVAKWGFEKLATAGISIDSIVSCFQALPADARTQIASEIFPNIENLKARSGKVNAGKLKYVLFLALPSQTLSAMLNELTGDDQSLVLTGISDPILLRGLADDIQSRLARNSLLYRKAYDDCTKNLPRTLTSLMLVKPVPNFYAILGVPRTATANDIKQSGRLLQMLHHPDRNIGDISAEQRFKDVTAALETLQDAEKKIAYDRFLPNVQYKYPSYAWMTMVPKAT